MLDIADIINNTSLVHHIYITNGIVIMTEKFDKYDKGFSQNRFMFNLGHGEFLISIKSIHVNDMKPTSLLFFCQISIIYSRNNRKNDTNLNLRL